MIWWASQPARALEERAAIAALQERAPWLQNLEWQLIPKNLVLKVNFEIAHADKVYRLSLTYPDYFPDTPPSVVPMERERLSSHQYGTGGELCLEFRADNWAPTITGAMMIESAYKLLTEESGESGEVPSAHRTTLGQEVRGAWLRFLFSSHAQGQVRELPGGAIRMAEISEHAFAGVWIATLTRIGTEGEPSWTERALVPKPFTRTALILRSDSGLALPAKPTVADLRSVFEAAGVAPVFDTAAKISDPFFLLSDPSNERLFCIVGEGGDRSVFAYRTVELPPPAARLPAQFLELATKTVGLVGCGSVGSKVAISLSRSGVSTFRLVDGDVFMPGNVVRNGLDLRASGVGKVEALRQAILEVNPGADVKVDNLVFGGQESSGATAVAMTTLGGCDIIVDATASADVFNLCAAISSRERKPMAWCSVFAGGIGGLVARVRPDIDPTPLEARDQISRWYADQGKSWTITAAAQGYDGSTEDEAPLIASDADVAVIAAHLARAALDVLATPDSSMFPAQAYAIGLSSEWIFAAPFDTYPIALQQGGDWGPTFDEDHEANFERLVVALFPQADDAA